MIKVFVGCAPNGEDAESCAVLEWSIHKHSTQAVQIEWMSMSHDPASHYHGWATERWSTPFSGFRWGIPARCGYQGHAIYMDSDVIVMRDLSELWTQDMAGAVVLGKGGGKRLCVSLWDCSMAEDVVLPLAELKADPTSHKRMGAIIRPFINSFSGHWNVLDGEAFTDLKDPTICAHHYTDMSSQPQLRHALPRLASSGGSHWFNGTTRSHPHKDMEALFDEMLAEAIVNGYGPDRYIPAKPYGDYNKASLEYYHGRPPAH